MTQRAILFVKERDIISKGCNALNLEFDLFSVFEKTMLFTCLRVDRSTVPNGLYVYEIRDFDDPEAGPLEIAKWVTVNHMGTLITNDPLPLQPDSTGNNARIYVDPDDWSFMEGHATLNAYLKDYPIQRSDKPKNKGVER